MKIFKRGLSKKPQDHKGKL